MLYTHNSHHEESGQLSQAERFYCDADAPELAVEMYTRVNQWDAAHKLATSYMSEGEVRMLYIDQVIIDIAYYHYHCCLCDAIQYSIVHSM
jgi:hypothetical protein